MAGTKKVLLVYAILMGIGGLIGILGVFLAWLDYGGGDTTTGWEIIRLATEMDYFTSGYIQWTPLLVLIFSSLAVIAGAAASAKPSIYKCATAVASGLIVLIAAIVFLLYTEPGFRVIDDLGIGVYFAIASGVLIVIVGLSRAFMKT
ncbi:MAG: hypothetical protein FWG60_00545 [Methanomassiliicoccaceae archaeon]|nr:hypothetical protein [Methanomassiliicoccaceae archaeon]